MIRRPPNSTLFPNTPLSQSSSHGPYPGASALTSRTTPGGPRMTSGSCRAGTVVYLRAYTSIGSSDRKSTRLNSSHSQISYAVFCLKKKKQQNCTRYDDEPHC